ncbi:acyl carrier protein [Micromonospora sp. NPDC051196]|uniref:acyl carrier protein n=1 Tax=Micromonospora sp. NPDC051196 TaxID=3155281 RepID=UPI00341241C2
MDHKQAIKEYIVTEFIPDIQVSELDDDYDLIAGGVIDSISLLRVITWLENRFDIPVDEVEIAEKNFTSVTAICEFVHLTAPHGTSAGNPG